jgi:hypothetical protein
MRTFWTIALAGALIGSVSFAPSLFAQNGDVNNCATKLATFVNELDSLLARKPDNLNTIYGLLLDHLPVRGCTADIASQAIKRSVYFKGEGRGSGDHSTQFSLSNSTTLSRGAAILLVLKDTGEWERPFAIWNPPYP